MTGSSPGAVPLSRLAAATTTQGLPAAARRRQLHQLTSPSPTAAPRGGRARRQPAQTCGPSSCAVVRGRMTAAPAAVRSLQSARDSSQAQTRVLESSEEGRRAAPLPCASIAVLASCYREQFQKNGMWNSWGLQRKAKDNCLFCVRWFCIHALLIFFIVSEQSMARG